MEKPYQIHLELLESLKDSADKFPDEIKTKLASIDSLSAKFEAEPSEELKKQIEQLSAKMWHNLKDWEEQDLPETVENDPPAPPANEEPVPPVPPVDNQGREDDVPPPPPAPDLEEEEQEPGRRNFLGRRR
jgi:hypothetical protein